MKNQKGISTLLGIVIVVAVAIVLFGGALCYQYITQPKENNQQQNQNTENTVDQTAGWKTYTNTQYGYEIKYPQEGKVEIITSDDGDGFRKLQPNQCILITYQNSYVTIGIPPYERGSCGMLNTGRGISDIRVKEQIVFNGKNYIAEGWKTEDNYEDLYFTANNVDINYGTDHPTNLYKYLNEVDYNNAKNLDYKIISTFKLTTPDQIAGCKKENETCGYSFGKAIGECCGGLVCTTEGSNIPDMVAKCKKSDSAVNPTSGWKTYTNTQYGFEFQYPKGWVIDDSGVGPTVQVWSSEKKEQNSVNAIIPIYSEFATNYEDLASFKAFAKESLGRDVSSVKDFVSSNFYSFAETTVSGKNAYAAIGVSSRAVYTLYIESGDGVYILSTEDFSEAGYYPKNPKIDKNVENIISTFKFTK